MRVCSLFFSSRLLVAIATGALAVVAVVLVTGGFVFHLGPLRVSAHRLTTPLAIAVLAALGAALHGRAALRDALAALAPFVDRHAASAALLIAASAAGVGVAFGTYSASSADPSGYVSYAELLASGRLGRDEPLARQIDWPEATLAFAPLGYRPGRAAGEIVPGYPPGLPMTMAAARIIGGETAPFLVAPLLGAVAVFCTYRIGAHLHSRAAGVTAAALFATSPVALFQIVQPMSDVPAAAWWTLAILCGLSPGRSAALAAGAAAGLAFLTRPNLLPLAGVVAVVAAGWPWPARSTIRLPRLWAVAAGVLTSAGVLAVLHRQLYGAPFNTGYGDVSEFFALANIPPNAVDYSWRLVTGETAALALAGVSVLARIARPRGPAPDVRRAAWLAALVAGVTVALYLPYGVFPDWSYLRFLLPAFGVLFVVVGALAVSAAARLPAPMRGVALILALAIVCSFNVVTAARESAFALQRFESRYRSAGRYLSATLAPASVIVTSQESGSASHYTGLPIVRWDLLGVDIDAALAALVALGRRPVVLVEDWEIPQLRARFPDSPAARVDWLPRAEFGDETRVFLFDPADRRAGPPAGIATDRVH